MNKTGVQEWAKHSVNIQTGCAHGCRYCYARWSALHYKRLANGCDWTTEVINQKAVDQGYRKRDGVIMFPTTHDITEHNYKQCAIVLQKLLDAGNQVLGVTKPHPSYISLITWMLLPHKERVEFRYTIGALDNNVLKFWEPNAPSFKQRMECLMATKVFGYKTSVSMEPLLEPERVVELVEAVSPYVTGDIWIGKLNKIRQRTAWYRNLCRAKDIAAVLVLDQEITRIEANQTDEAVMEIYDKLKDHPKIEWKDSYKSVIERCKADHWWKTMKENEE